MWFLAITCFDFVKSLILMMMKMVKVEVEEEDRGNTLTLFACM